MNLSPQTVRLAKRDVIHQVANSLTWLVLDVILGATLGSHLAKIHFLTQNLDLGDSRHTQKQKTQPHIL